MIEIRNLYKTFGRTAAVRDLSLDIKKGQVLRICRAERGWKVYDYVHSCDIAYTDKRHRSCGRI